MKLEHCLSLIFFQRFLHTRKMNQVVIISTLFFVITVIFSAQSAPTQGVNMKDVNSTSSASSNASTEGNISGHASGGNVAHTDGLSNSGTSSSSQSAAAASSTPEGSEFGYAASGADAEGISSVQGESAADGTNSHAGVDANTSGETDTDTFSSVIITNNPKSQMVDKNAHATAVRAAQKLSVAPEEGIKSAPLCIDGSPQSPVPSAGASPGSQSATSGTADAHSEASQQGSGYSNTGTDTGSVSTPDISVSCAHADAFATGTEGSQTSSTSSVGTGAQNSE